jgi:3-oxoacyl-[acyl-carrier protein] reductase
LKLAHDKLVKSGASGLQTVIADIADAKSVKRLVHQVLQCFGRIDILVINSGHAAYGGLSELSEQQWYHAFELLLMSTVRLSQLVLPSMRANKRGDIVFLGSSTVREPPPHLLLSTVMRLGVVGLAKTLSREVARDNIRVNLISPGYFDTGRVHRRIQTLIRQEGISHKSAAARICGGIPIGRLGAAQELAELVAFVASRKAGFLIGSNILIDGGSSQGLF